MRIAFLLFFYLYVMLFGPRCAFDYACNLLHALI